MLFRVRILREVMNTRLNAHFAPSRPEDVPYAVLSMDPRVVLAAPVASSGPSPVFWHRAA